MEANFQSTAESKPIDEGESWNSDFIEAAKYIVAKLADCQRLFALCKIRER